MKSMFRRTPKQGKFTFTPASVHLSNTARSLIELREAAEIDCADIIGGDFDMADFREPR